MLFCYIFSDNKILPEFPLIPASRGFCITLRKTLATFKDVLAKEGIIMNILILSNFNVKEQKMITGEGSDIKKLGGIKSDTIIKQSDVTTTNGTKEIKKIISNDQCMENSQKKSEITSTSISSTALNETKKITSERNAS